MRVCKEINGYALAWQPSPEEVPRLLGNPERNCHFDMKIFDGFRLDEGIIWHKDSNIGSVLEKGCGE
jgi:hypothetical protein